VRKLGVPGHEEFAMGALGSGGLVVLNPEVLHLAGVSDTALRQVIERERRELQRRERVYRGDRAPLDVSGKTVILVDDGLATGSTMRAAVAALKQKRPARIVVAVPVAAPDVCESLRKEVDEVVCTATPEPFRAVGLWYDEFPQTSDEEVHRLMDLAETTRRERAQGSDYAERR
jgi:putative phosphoribosyl transferase